MGGLMVELIQLCILSTLASSNYFCSVKIPHVPYMHHVYPSNEQPLSLCTAQNV